MKITICGSMSFAMEMLEAKIRLERYGHICLLPHDTEEILTDVQRQVGEATRRKIHNDLIRRHYRKIADSDAVLVLNKSKNGSENYIGANTFLEMGFAFVLNKTIFVLNPLPENHYIRDEAEAMAPIVLHGNLEMIGAIYAETV